MTTFDEFLKKIKDKYDIEKINKAYIFLQNELNANKKLEHILTHSIEVCNILFDLNVDENTIIAAMLHEVINNSDKDDVYERCAKEFGTDMASIIDSISKINKLELNNDAESSSQYLRKILVGLAEDVRVLFVKLADRLHNMRTEFNNNPEKTKEKAIETMEILVPIAHRLGINSIKSELENISLKYIKPDVYNDILDKLNASIDELNDSLIVMKNNLSKILKEANINFEIMGRVKSVYSIYNKLSHGRQWSDIYDILALRIFVDSESDCYTTLGLIHSKYRSVPKRFKDYIANPKANMYQSLHTTVFGDSGRLYEIQIRTYEMDLIAEKGIAAHWTYKESAQKKVQKIMEQKLEYFRAIIESNESEEELMSSFSTDFLQEVIYVYTPKGDVVELPKCSSPIDFAYRIHSNVGDRAVGAIVNDVIVPFTHKLEDGDVISIMTSSSAKPSKDWLKIVKSSQAKTKIKSYFNKKLKSEYILKGKNILDKEIKKRKLSINDILNETALNKISKTLKTKDFDEVYLLVGSLRYTAGYIINIATESDDDKTIDMFFEKNTKIERETKSYKGDVFVSGEKNILINLAKCCNPIKGDDIVGFITKNNGITIHKRDCVNVSKGEEKLIDVSWNYESDETYIVSFNLITSKEDFVLPKLIETATKLNIKIISFDSLEENRYFVKVAVKNKEKYNEFLKLIKSIKYVVSIIE